MSACIVCIVPLSSDLCSPDTAVGDIEDAFKTFTSRADIVVLLINQNVSVSLCVNGEPVCLVNGGFMMCGQPNNGLYSNNTLGHLHFSSTEAKC